MHSTSSPTQQTSTWLAQFGAALDRGDWSAAADLFGNECYWRDLISLTWNIKTQEGKPAIQAMLAATCPRVQPSNWQSIGDATTELDVTEGWFTFETSHSRGKGHLRLKDGKCWTLLTSMLELKEFEEPCGTTRIPGTDHGAFRNRETWLESRTREEAELGYVTQPYVVIVGGGQGGIGLAARLKRLGVPALISAKPPRAGASWRSRY
jgi:putative flavoprotein involved in K+ transport